MGSEKAKHIYEIDLIRVITAISVVTVHVISFTVSLNTSVFAQQVQTLVYHALHFNREMFMFVTALVLVYVYKDRQFSKFQYWFKRFLLVFIPYVIWSFFYVKINNPSLGGGSFIHDFILDIVTGNASFQLYYIILTLQFYFIFPWFLTLFKKIQKYPWRVLGISLVIQFIIYYFDFHYLENGALSGSSYFWDKLSSYQDRIFIFYQLFFMMGAYTAVYFDNIKIFFSRWGKYIPVFFIAILVLFSLHFFMQINIFNESLLYAASVLQPTMVVYAIASILFVGWFVYLWGERKNREGLPKFAKSIEYLAGLTFGVYFVHPIFLSYSMDHIVPILPSFLTTGGITLIILILVILMSFMFCSLILFLSLGWIIGKPSKPRTISFARIAPFFESFKPLFKTNSKILFLFGILLLVFGLLSFYKFFHSRVSVASIGPMSGIYVQLPVKSQLKGKIINDDPMPLSSCSSKMSLSKGKSTYVELTVNGVKRSYLIYIPKSYSNTSSHPLVLNFHGYGSTTYRQEALTSFNSEADAENFIVVYPQGLVNRFGISGWNTGLHQGFEYNDTLFVNDILNQVQSNLCVNPYRIFATGFSNGGGMVNLLACQFSDRIAAFAPVAGSYVTPASGCNPSRSVPIIEFHGLRDKTVPFRGNIKRHEPYVLNWANSWASRDNCNKSPTITHISKDITEYRWGQCADNATVKEYSISNTGHTWPVELFPDSSGKNVPIDKLIWEFFNSHPLMKGNTKRT